MRYHYYLHHVFIITLICLVKAAPWKIRHTCPDWQSADVVPNPSQASGSVFCFYSVTFIRLSSSSGNGFESCQQQTVIIGLLKGNMRFSPHAPTTYVRACGQAVFPAAAFHSGPKCLFVLCLFFLISLFSSLISQCAAAPQWAWRSSLWTRRHWWWAGNALWPSTTHPSPVTWCPTAGWSVMLQMRRPSRRPGTRAWWAPSATRARLRPGSSYTGLLGRASDAPACGKHQVVINSERGCWSIRGPGQSPSLTCLRIDTQACHRHWRVFEMATMRLWMHLRPFLSSNISGH